MRWFVRLRQLPVVHSIRWLVSGPGLLLQPGCAHVVNRMQLLESLFLQRLHQRFFLLLVRVNKPSQLGLRARHVQLPQRVRRSGGGVPFPPELGPFGVRHRSPHRHDRVLLRCHRGGREPVEPPRPGSATGAFASDRIQPRGGKGRRGARAVRVRHAGAGADAGHRADAATASQQHVAIPRCARSLWCARGSHEQRALPPSPKCWGRCCGYNIGTASVAAVPAFWRLCVPATTAIRPTIAPVVG
mmetsp:Transcript_19756/g.62754  ORF Transcript_19756/g.62754 Transcript_19756/m.62754 type:complete len:244 (-) Transcript_19756:42-773(-)